ncbi:hypothetical protein PPSIR1_32432 [Plesiocystis pacifica SIR-1]|uniref:Lipoprotein n=1 Tax=Plesiocystis pacifica SIR-1 TaxID=391625 RepID=A6G5M2_9BACT|nr:hypothetical protein [Plesiocystis pacifica]EDM78803.1 hypothetical protein PPSIR1_32432 [Plesiocystis pacifica SIR-1]
MMRPRRSRRTRSLFSFVALAGVLSFTSACSKDDPAKAESDVPADAQPEDAGKEAEDTPAKPDLPEGASLLAKHVEAAGGAEAIASFESILIEGTVDTGKQKLEGTSKLWWKKGGSFYLEQNIEGVGMSRAGYDGETMWTEDPISGLRKLEGKEAVSYIQNSAMFPAHDWQQHFAAANTKGKQTLDDGTEVWEVELVSEADGPPVTMGFDTTTGLLSFMKSKQVTAMGEMPFEAYAEGYEAKNGYQFAMKKRSSVTGLLELTEEITKFEVNVEIDDQMFVFPNTREAVPADPTKQPPVEAPAETTG